MAIQYQDSANMKIYILCTYTHKQSFCGFWGTEVKLMVVERSSVGQDDCTGLRNLSGAADELKLHTRCRQVGLRDGRTGVSRGSFSSHMHFPPTISLGVVTQINPPLFSHRRASTREGWQFESTLQPCTQAKKKYRPLFR